MGILTMSEGVFVPFACICPTLHNDKDDNLPPSPSLLPQLRWAPC